MELGKFLGEPVSRLLGTSPFSDWRVKKTVESGLEEDILQYVFDGNGVELRCDKNGRVETIFLYTDQYGGFDFSLSEIPFPLDRENARALYGSPSAKGEAIEDPVLGDYGPWDRFDRGHSVLHVEYTSGGDGLRTATLMTLDAVP